MKFASTPTAVAVATNFTTGVLLLILLLLLLLLLTVSRDSINSLITVIIG